VKVGSFDKERLETYSTDGLNVCLAEPFTYTTAAGEKILVPAGSESDGASVPRVFWRIFPPFGRYWRAALLHDFLYRSTEMPKAKCDAIFHEAMLACGVGRAKAWTIYQGVNWFGVFAFKNCRKRSFK
jgi:hypothetical protein